MTRDQHNIVIVGAGPAGSAAALRIGARRPDLARRTLVLDRHEFPRDKLCAGGVSPLAEAQLARVRAAPDVAACRVTSTEVVVGPRRELLRTTPGYAFRTVQRREFDAALLALARKRGIGVAEGERVTAVDTGRAGVSVVTDRAEYRALAVIGTDGTTGVVRRAVGLPPAERWFALEVLEPANPERDAAFAQGRATFDFGPIEAGLGGYCWIFPSRDAGVPVLNCGIAICAPDCARFGKKARSFLVAWLAARGIRCDASSIRGHGGIVYDPEARLGTHRVCVAGDAAGIDPYVGEGIPCALGTGIAAADAVIAAINRGDFDLTRHHEHVRRSPIGRLMERRRLRAHAVYRRDAVDRYFHAVRLFGRPTSA
jgi:menaquinone-9 beta-reductase